MQATRRRTRTPDPLASRAAVQAILAQLQTTLGAHSPKTEKELVQLLRATGYAERHPHVQAGRGRKSRWSAYDKAHVRQVLTDILARETKRIGLRSFLEHYLLILEFPAEVAEALEEGRLNLFEAEQLARLTTKRLGLSEAKSKQRRQALLRAHLQTSASGIRLKAKVDAALHLARHPEAATATSHSDDILAAAATLESELSALSLPSGEWLDSLPPEHLFGEYLHLIGSLLREIRAEELQAAELERIGTLAEPLIQYLNALHKQQNSPITKETMQEVVRNFFI